MKFNKSQCYPKIGLHEIPWDCYFVLLFLKKSTVVRPSASFLNIPWITSPGCFLDEFSPDYSLSNLKMTWWVTLTGGRKVPLKNTLKILNRTFCGIVFRTWWHQQVSIYIYVYIYIHMFTGLYVCVLWGGALAPFSPMPSFSHLTLSFVAAAGWSAFSMAECGEPVSVCRWQEACWPERRGRFSLAAKRKILDSPFLLSPCLAHCLARTRTRTQKETDEVFEHSPPAVHLEFSHFTLR